MANKIYSVSDNDEYNELLEKLQKEGKIPVVLDMLDSDDDVIVITASPDYEHYHSKEFYAEMLNKIYDNTDAKE